MRLKAWLTILAALATAILVPASLRPPPVVPASAPAAEFSADRAFPVVEAIASEAHPPSSAANERVRQYLVGQLLALGYQPTFQRFSTISATYGPLELQNIIVRIPGTANTGAVMLAAHYDSKPLAPGAGDDGAAVAALIETLRALAASPPLRNDLIVLLTDGEEAGLLGGMTFARENPIARDVAFVGNFDAAGSSGPLLMYQSSAGNGELIRGLAAGVPHPVANSVFEFGARNIRNETDFMPFRAAGLTGMNFAFLGGHETYHQAIDTPANLNRRTLQHVGETALGLARHFGNASFPLPSVSDAVFFNPVGGIFLHYAGSWVRPLSVGMAVLVVILLVAWRRRPGSGRRALVAAAFGLSAASVTAFAVGWTLAPSLPFRQSGYVYILAGWETAIGPSHGFWILIGGAIVAIALATLTYVWLGRRIDRETFLLCRAASWSVLAIVLGFALPPLSFIGFWPALLDCGQLLVFRRFNRIAAVVPPIVAIALLSPLLWLLWQILPQAASVSLVIIVLLSWSVLPVADEIFPPSRTHAGGTTNGRE